VAASRAAVPATAPLQGRSTPVAAQPATGSPTTALPEAVTASQAAAPGAPAPHRKPAPRPEPALQVTDRDPIHDPTNPAYALLQKPSEALRGLPLDRMGRVNWVQALDAGLVAPRADLEGAARMRRLDADIVMTDTRQMPHVLFPHRAHTEWLSCDSCHPEPFVARNDANAITMDAIFLGKYCGVCHDKVAFSFSTFVCERCHSIPHEGSPAKWW
jgi:c(7)-type cytochrome triheme protein